MVKEALVYAPFIYVVALRVCGNILHALPHKE